MDSKYTLKLQILFFIIYAGTACYGPFQAVFFGDRALNYTQIGIAFAAGALISMIVQPIWGYLSDKYFNKRNSLLIAMAATFICILFFIKADNFESILMLITISTIFMSGIYPLLDSYTFDMIEYGKNLSYSKFRFMASASYGIANLVLGYVIKAWGINMTFIIYAILLFLAILLLNSMKFEGSRSVSRIQYTDLKETLSDVRLIVFLLTVFLMNAAIIGGTNYMNELIIHVNGDVSNLGMVWFTTCTIEVITFCFIGKLIRKIGVIKVYCISILLFGLKFGLNFILGSAFLIILVQILEGIGFTLFITSSLEYLNSNIKAETRASMVSIYAAVGGLGSFAAGLFGGAILNRFTPSQLYGFLALICFVALTFSISLRSKSDMVQLSDALDTP